MTILLGALGRLAVDGRIACFGQLPHRKVALGVPSLRDASPVQHRAENRTPESESSVGVEGGEQSTNLRFRTALVPDSVGNPDSETTKTHNAPILGFRQHQFQRNIAIFVGHSENGGRRLHVGRPVARVSAAPGLAEWLRIVQPLQHPGPVGAERSPPSLRPRRAANVVRVSCSEVVASLGVGLEAHRPLHTGARRFEPHCHEPGADDYLVWPHRIASRVDEHQRPGTPVFRAQLSVCLHLVRHCIGASALELHGLLRPKHSVVSFVSHGGFPNSNPVGATM